MAGLFDSIGIDPVVAANIAAQDAATKRMQDVQNQYGAGLHGITRGLSDLGVAFGQGFGNAVVGAEDPTVTATKKSAELIAKINGLTEDPASSAFAAQAAKLALAHGRPDVAAQLTQAAGERAKAEAAVAAKAAQQEIDNQKNLFGALPATGKLSLIVEHPDQISKMFGFTPDQTKNFQEEARKSLETLRLENEKKLADLKPLHVSPVVKQDVVNSLDVLSSQGIKPASVGGLDETQLGQFASTLSQQVAAELDKAANERRPTSGPVVQKDLFDALVAAGAVTLGTKGYDLGGYHLGETGKTIATVDPAKAAEVFRSRLSGTATTAPTVAAPRPKSLPQVGEVRGGYKFIGGDPSKQSSWEKQ